jgi:urease accessory protein
MREGRRFGPRPPTVLSTGPNENHKQREHQTMSRMMLSLAALAATTLAATPALAHAQDTGAMGFWAGLGHPFAGLDHLLAMVAVGLWASQLGGRALWAIPASFVAAMAAGASFALAGIGLPAIEFGIAGSVILFGLLVAGAARVPTMAGCAIVTVFALFHGQAHGLAMPATADPMLYGLGFALATAALHAAGVGIGLAGGRIGAALGPWSLRASGAAVAASGMAILAGAGV